MRVLFVTNMWPSPEKPWHGTFVAALKDGLELVGVEVDVLEIRGWERRSAYLRTGAWVAALNARGIPHDLVHAHYGHSGVVARMQLRAPLVLSYCGDDLLGTVAADGGRTRRSLVEASVFRQLSRVCRATITRTRAMQERLPLRARGRDFIVPSPVDLARFQPGSRDGARRSIGWPEDEQVALFVGDPAVAAKNFPLAQEAARLAAQERPGLRLEIASNVPHDEMPVLLRAADALLFTSRSEGSPNAVKEAMAAELPIVSTPVGDVSERLDGVDGCVVKPPSAAALAQGLLEVLGQRVPAARAAVEPLGLEPTGRRVRDVYEFALGR